jgi:Phage integrase family
MFEEADALGLTGGMPSKAFTAVVVTARVKIDKTGATVEVPTLLTERGVVYPLLKFCCDRSQARSLDWLQKLCHACALFLEFAAANRGMADRELLNAFAIRLHTGTINVEAGIDPSGLCWRPVSRPTARRVLSQLTTFFGAFSELQAHLRPQKTPYDHAMERAAYAHARERAFLGHTWAVNPSRPDERFPTSVLLPRRDSVQDDQPPAFPEDRFMDFLLRGWCVNGRYSYRDMLITLLLNGGGVRNSEPFHLYVTDIHHDSIAPGSALVLFHHPVEGAAPEDWVDGLGNTKSGTRGVYLNERWGIGPRTRQLGANHAGWKGASLTRAHGSKFFRVHWFVPQLGAIFWNIWNRYLVELVSTPRAHPFAFINLARGEKGDVYKMSAFRQAHAEAVRRTGLTPSRVEGTTPHGHRHAYGGRLARAGVPGEDIQRYMHHCSFESHLVYTKPFQSEVASALERATKRLSDTGGLHHWDSCVDEVEYRMRRS